eukprot:gb/GFBE01039308.1/.p1 GENE.gb/GFBE01039308.1/~~gb/GFBE01039308.1/.p1  ORF type:complete len:348 (+),score=57.36 gb/GFBE01039308.1/:1-1044(+)
MAELQEGPKNDVQPVLAPDSVVKRHFFQCCPGKQKLIPDIDYTIDWNKWENVYKPPNIYDPPQLKDINCLGIPHANRCCGCQHRSPCCKWPVVPCCCAAMCQYCLTCPSPARVKISDPDEWLMKLLSTSASPNCPDFLKGVWWMCDNVGIPEVLTTFQDAYWQEDQMLGLKPGMWNWGVPPTAWGAGQLKGCWYRAEGPGTWQLRMEISPNKKWVSLGGYFMYVIQPGDTFTRPDGTPIKAVPGEDMMRCNFKQWDDATTEVMYQYMVRKIAYLDDSGKLVKTKNYDELLRRATLPDEPGCCCNYVYPHSKEDFWKTHEPMSDELLFQWASSAAPFQQVMPPTSARV